MSAGLSVALINSSENVEKVSASSYSVNTVPTTIDLNDASDSTIRSYYNELNSLTTSERQGTNLLKNLKPILKNGQKYFSYDSGATTAVWQAYEIVDRDWDMSPASAISGYNATTNKITGYVYGKSNTNVGTNPYIHALYVNRNVTNEVRAWGNHNQDQWGINQEHIWAKSCGFNDDSPAAGARGDLMHLWAGNGRVNGTNHSNYYFGYVDTTKSYSDASSYATTLSGNRHGKSKTMGGTYTVFEPQDSDKGDIARALFYMAARYNYLSGSDSDGIDAGNPNLEIINQLNWAPGTSYTSSTTNKGQMGILQDLLEWNRLDPPDQWEIHRNNLLYNNFTKNRNPFIDFPEWAEFIWGKSEDGNYSSTSTGYAVPSSDTINDFSASGGSVSVTGVSVSPTSATIAVDGTIQLTPTVSPSNATNKTVTWSSSNTSIATVSNGVVTGKAAGNATITVTTMDGSYTATCTVTIKALSSITVSGQTTAFETGDDFVFGGTVTAHYSDSTTANVTSSASFSGYDLSTAGNQTVTVSYGGKTTTYSITVTQSSSGTEEDSVTAASGALEGWTASGTGSAYADGSVKFDSSSDNVYKTDIFSGDVSSGMTSLTVTINSKINGTPTATNSYKVEALDSSGNVLASDVKTGADIVTTSYGDAVFTIDSGLTGCTGIKITYATKGGGNWGVKSVSWSATYSTGGSTVTLSSIAVKTAPTKITYTVGDGFDANGLVITATYSDSSTEDISYEGNEDAFEFDPIDDLQTSDVSVTISYGGKTCTQSITVSSAKTLSSITLNTDNVTKSFYVSDTFEHENLVVTANFSDSSSDVVSSSATVSTPDMSTAGEKTITVSYTYSGTTKTATYTITVHESGGVVTDSQRIVSKSDSAYFEEGSIYLTGTTTVGSASCDAFTATQTKVSGSSSVPYTYDEIRVYTNHSFMITPNSGYTITSVVLTANSSAYASAVGGTSVTNCTKTVSGSTVTLTPTDGTSVLGFTNSAQSRINYVTVNYSYTPPATLSSITLDITNVQTTFSVGDTFNYTGLVVTAHYTDSSSKTVTPISVSTPSTATTGNKTVIVAYTENDVTKTANYIITVNANPSISWTAPTINVYSGSTLSGSDVNAWAVTYNDGAGHQTVLTYSQLTVKLGDTTISIPHTWSASDDGKALTATYNSLTTTASSEVAVTQSVNAITQTSESSTVTSDLTFTAACGGSGTADDGATWAVTSDAAESNFDSTKGIHYGTGSAAVEYIQLVSDSFTTGTITQVVVNASGASGVTGSVSVTVGGNTFGEEQSFDSTASNKTFTGSASAGRIVVRIYKASAAVKAIYCKSVVVTNNVPGSSTVISNSVEHIAAQRVAVKFAKAFNAAMDITSGCTTNLESAWSTCSSAYDTFLSEAAALGETEEAYAKSLIANATKQYTDDSGEACIERMMKTYQVCVQKHGQTPFMSELVSLSKIAINPLQISVKNSSTAIIIIVISATSLIAIAGYFYFRKKKEN